MAWADGTVSAGFRFDHDLHRTVLYDRVPAARRARLHAAVADRLERAYGPAAPAHAAELAAHLLAAHDPARAVPYLQAAATQALGRSAPARPPGTWRPCWPPCRSSPRAPSGTWPSWPRR